MTADTARVLDAGQVSGEELFAMGDIGPCELIDGRIVSMNPVGGEHGALVFTLGALLRNFVAQRDLGTVLGGEVGIFTKRNPDRIRGMDIAFVSKERLQQPPKGFLEVPPELVVEVVSPHDRWEEVREKIMEYFPIGVDRVWLIEPRQKSVAVYRTPSQFVTLHEADTLEGEGLLQDLRIPVKTIFLG